MTQIISSLAIAHVTIGYRGYSGIREDATDVMLVERSNRALASEIAVTY